MSPMLLQAVVRIADARTPDADLLSRFTRNRDERAFEELVRRHGPLVWAVCRHLLPHHADAEDAFQAVFLALVRGASSIHVGKALPAWLHGVAVRVAIKARRSAVRRRQREQRAAVREAHWPVPDESWATLMAAVHEEIRQLPEAEQTAFVLCDLEGVRQPDAAARLGWPLGTLSGRLCKARQRLLDQLTRRGIAPTVLAVGGLAGSTGTVPAALLQQVTSFPTASAAGVSSTVAELARGLVEGTTMRIKILAATLLVAGALGMSGGALVLSQADAQSGGGSSGGKPGLGAGGPGFPGGAAPLGGSGLPPLGATPPRADSAPPPLGVGGPPRRDSAFSPPATLAGAWEYKFVDIKNDRKEFELTLIQQGKDGWEYAGSERDFPAQGRSELVLVFKKHRGGTIIRGGGGFSSGGGSGFMMGGPDLSGLPGMMGVGVGGGRVGIGGGAEVEARIFKLSGAQAPEVATRLEKAFPKARSFRVVAEPVSNTILVTADPATMKKIQEMIESLDVKGPSGAGGSPHPPAGGTSSRPAPGGMPGGMGSAFGPMGGSPGGPPVRGEIRIFHLKHATAQELSAVVERVFPNADVTPEPRSNQLIIRSDDTTAAEIEALIARLDVEGPLKR